MDLPGRRAHAMLSAGDAFAPPRAAMSEARDLHERPAELLQRLLRFDTTNPPGSERACLEWLAGLLQDAGLQITLVAAEPGRPSLVARLPGRGDAPPLLLEGHVDVVSTAGQRWTYPPFAGEIVDGYIWGRGALDMKGGVAMFVAAALRAAATGLALAGDVVLALVSDEESGGDSGAAHLVRERPDLLAGVRYALGEFGGFSLNLGGRRFYPIQVAEKQLCWLRATVRGPAGHGALPMRGGTMARLANLLRVLDRRRLPVHITPVTRGMIEQVAAELPAAAGVLLRGLLDRRVSDRVLDLLGERGRVFDPLLHNTVNATIVRGGDKINVIPAEATVELDGRLLPGFAAEDLLLELQALIGPEVELDVLRHDPARRSQTSASTTCWPACFARPTPRGRRSRSCLRRSPTHDTSRAWESRPTASCRCNSRPKCASWTSSTPPTSASRSMRCASAPTPCTECSSATAAT
jgi:acetylornithine deacetylase/succinyl-diaminopimelate desuccinylase-like protein